MGLTQGPTLELVADARDTLGEGPVWDVVRGILWWVDIPAQVVHHFDPRTGVDLTVAVGSAVGAVTLRHDGTLLVALAEGLAKLDPENGRLESLLSFETGNGTACVARPCCSRVGGR
jgi:sugar lactone lactonase YvrE